MALGTLMGGWRIIKTMGTKLAGGIVGVASARRARSLHWRTAERMGWAWGATVPGAAAIGALALFILRWAGLDGG
jgi:PiT family inorganic phosphate transporter